MPTLLAALRGDDRPQTPILGGGRSAVLCLVVDASGSMGARRRLARVKGALEAALRDAYARRDRVAVVAFAATAAARWSSPARRWNRPPPLRAACPPAGARRWPPASRTPQACSKGSIAATSPAGAIAVVLTDGRVADPDGEPAPPLARVVAAADRTVVVDTEEGRVRLGLAAELAGATGADLTRLVTPEAAEPRRRSAA